MIKTIHITTALISITFFIIRMYWVIKIPTMMERKWVKIVPHVNDTILLLMGVMLTVAVQQYPFVHGWITAKIFALLFYIGFGTYALKRAKLIKNKIIFFILALLSFTYIVVVAESKSVIDFIY